MKRRRGRVFIWFAAMAGLIFFMVSIVDTFRGNRGNKQIEEAYALLDEGEISLGIDRLEEAEETYQRIGERFPEIDTLFGLYLRVQEFGKAQRKLRQIYRYAERETWFNASVRFIRASRDKEVERAMDVTEELVNRDYYLTKYEYPADLDSLLGITLSNRLISDGNFEGFRRQEDWSDDEVEWWYYVADDGETIETGNFHRTAGKAFGGKKKLFVDLFTPVKGSGYNHNRMGYSGRLVFEGEALADSLMIQPEMVAFDSLDNHSRWEWYVDRNDWDMVLFSWNTVLMSAPVQEPYYQDQFYLKLREGAKFMIRENLMDLVGRRELIVQDSNDEDCYDGTEVPCWKLDPSLLDPLPIEFAEVLAEKFAVSQNSLKVQAGRVNPRIRSLSVHLDQYVVARKRLSQ